MTDLPSAGRALPGRLGVAARIRDGELVLDLTPTPHVLHHGIIRASVLSFLIDAVTGIPLDGDQGAWTLTTDMSVRMRPMPAPPRVTAASRVVRQGRRSVTCVAELTTDDGTLVATGAVGFARIPRADTDPPKPAISPERIVAMFDGSATPGDALRTEAGIEVVDAGEGVVQVDVTADLRNPAGTMQGAMVALVAEAAAEDLIATRFGGRVVVTDLDLRYLAKTQAGPVRTRSRLLGTGPDAAVQVELVDTSTDELTTLVYARTATLPS